MISNNKFNYSNGDSLALPYEIRNKSSDIWQDSVFIARKPVYSPWIKVKSETKCCLQHKELLINNN